MVPGEELYDRVLNLGTTEVAASHQASVDKIKSDLPHVSKWHMYEGGTHMDFPAYDNRNADHVKVARSIRAYWNSASFTNALNSFGNWWGQLPGSGELMWFNLYGVDSPDNPWGYYKSAADTTPEYTGARLFIQNYPW